MNNNKSNVKASWLHISDLHVFPEADTTLMLDDYLKLANIISPQFLIVTGDFRHKAYKTDFSLARKYLELLLSAFHIDKKDTFLVPGNHDVNEYEGMSAAISDICSHSEDNYNIYSKYLTKMTSLYSGFSDYNAFVHEFYSGSGVTDARLIDPGGVHCIVWNDLINVLFMNTALISDGEDHDQILDISLLAQCEINFQYPTIMLGHHGIDSLYSSHAERVKSIIDRRKISAYLHGDRHRYANHPISQISVPNRTIPSITCAKSAPQSGDSFSEFGVVYYEWRNDDNTYIQAYRWTQKGFIEDSTYFYDIDKRYFFPMLYDNKSIVDGAQILYKQVKNLMNNYEIFMNGKWVEEAENIWQTNHHEGIGKCLLVYYCEKANEGVVNAHQRGQEIYYALMMIPDCDFNTQKMLDATRKLLFSSEY